MEVVIAPASAFDFVETVSDGGAFRPMTKVTFGLYARQVSEGCAYSFREPMGRMILVAGLYPDGDEAEAWWSVGAAVDPLWLLRGIRAARRMLEQIGRDAAPIIARVNIAPGGGGGGVAGRRIAALFGFTDAGTAQVPGLGSVNQWRRVFPAPEQG